MATIEKRHMFMVNKSLWEEVVQMAAKETMRRGKQVTSSQLIRELVTYGLREYEKKHQKK